MRRTIPVWPLAIRLAHWTLAISVLTALWLHEGGPWHEWLGYLAGSVAAARLLYGLFTRRRHLAFRGFVFSPRKTYRYARAVLRGRAPRHLGHNPLGGWMIVALLLDAAVAGGSGALYATDAFWGDDRVYIVHEISSWALAVLVPLHLGGVLLSSRLHRESLLKAMLDGRKPVPRPGDVGLNGRQLRPTSPDEDLRVALYALRTGRAPLRPRPPP